METPPVVDVRVQKDENHDIRPQPAEAAQWDAYAVVIESRSLLVASPPLLMRSRLVIISAIVCGIEKEVYSRRRPWRCEKGREGEKKTCTLVRSFCSDHVWHLHRGIREVIVEGRKSKMYELKAAVASL